MKSQKPAAGAGITTRQFVRGKMVRITAGRTMTCLAMSSISRCQKISRYVQYQLDSSLVDSRCAGPLTAHIILDATLHTVKKSQMFGRGWLNIKVTIISQDYNSRLSFLFAQRHRSELFFCGPRPYGYSGLGLHANPEVYPCLTGTCGELATHAG